MPAVRPLNRRTLLWRPLLPYGRAELEAYAERHKLAFVCDPSNESGDYLRNWLRNDGLPQWRARLPQLDQHILSGIGLLQDELAVLEETAARTKRPCKAAGCSMPPVGALCRPPAGDRFCAACWPDTAFRRAKPPCTTSSGF